MIYLELSDCKVRFIFFFISLEIIIERCTYYKCNKKNNQTRYEAWGLNNHSIKNLHKSPMGVVFSFFALVYFVGFD